MWGDTQATNMVVAGPPPVERPLEPKVPVEARMVSNSVRNRARSPGRSQQLPEQGVPIAPSPQQIFFSTSELQSWSKLSWTLDDVPLLSSSTFLVGCPRKYHPLKLNSCVRQRYRVGWSASEGWSSRTAGRLCRGEHPNSRNSCQGRTTDMVAQKAGPDRAAAEESKRPLTN